MADQIIYVKLDPSCKAKPYYFSNGFDNLSKNYTLKQANAHMELLESLGYKVEDRTF